MQHRVPVDAGIVHQDVHAIEARLDRTDQRITVSRTRHVEAEPDRAPATFRGDARRVRFIDVGTDDRCAFQGQLAGDPLADAAPGARNDRDPSFEFQSSDSTPPPRHETPT